MVKVTAKHLLTKCRTNYELFNRVQQRDKDEKMEKDILADTIVYMVSGFEKLSRHITLGKMIYKLKRDFRFANSVEIFKWIRENADSIPDSETLRKSSIGDHLRLFELVQRYPLLAYSGYSYSRTLELFKRSGTLSREIKNMSDDAWQLPEDE